MIGRTFNNRYRVERKIGSGRFADVYRGIDLKLKRHVAIKVLNEPSKDSERRHFKERFLREAETLARIEHANVITVYDYADDEGPLYLVMELVEGPTLLELTNQAKLTMPEICSIARQICSAMSYAHKQGIVHRDLSMQNVMIATSEKGEQVVKILDFGLAKIIGGETMTTVDGIVGTIYFIAPEHIRGQKIDGRVDIWAFGVGLYRMVSGRFPFDAQHPAAVMFLILNEDQRELTEGVSPRMRELIHRCLQKDPRERIRDFDDLIPELDGIRLEAEQDGQGNSSHLVNLDRFVNRNNRRNPYLNRVMIRHPSHFFGREKDVQRIYSRLDAPHPQSISIVGERRIGKSSLLNYVYHASNRQLYMQNHDNAVFAYLDFQRDADYDTATFIDFLFNVFTYESKEGHDYTDRPKTQKEFKAVVKTLNDAGKRIIIFMDEFESITRNSNFEETFFSFLRSLANSYRVAYVTSSRDDLQMMCHNKEISDSPFFNIFSSLPLRPFTWNEALELISLPSEEEGIPLAPHADRIRDMAGLFPLFLQIACSNVFEFLMENPDTEPNWLEIERAYMDEAEKHYRFVWNGMDKAARNNLRRVAEGKAINSRYAFVNEELERRGYLVESEVGVGLCSDSFKGFVMKQNKDRSGIFRILGRGA